MKKMLKWYEILDGASLLDFAAINAAAAAAAAADTDDAGATSAEEAAQLSEHEKSGGDMNIPLVEEGEEKPAKKARAKKDTAAEPEADAEKPAKKAARKKADAPEDGEAPKKAAKAKKKDAE